MATRIPKSSRKKPANARVLPRKSPTQSRAIATVDAVLEAAAHILREGGYDALSTNRAAARAGVSVGSLYQYFPGKDAIVAALLMRLHERHSARIAATLGASLELPLSEAIRMVIWEVFQLNQADPKLNAVLLEQLPKIGTLKQVVDATERGIREPLSMYLQLRGAELGSAVDADAAAFVLTHTIQPFMHRLLIYGSKASRVSMIEALTRMVSGYLTGA